MPITKLDESTDDALGFEVSGDVTKADYELHGTIRLLLDLTDFHWEKASAWGSDLRFGHRFHDKIDRLAVVGNKNWEKHLASLASPFYAKDSAFFETRADAWTWLED